MTHLTYSIINNKGMVLKKGIESYNDARMLAERLNASIKEEYTPFEVEEPKFDRSKCKKSEKWIAEHSN